MNIKALRIFCGIVETGSLAEAAERLNTSASSASRLLSLLEAELDLQLFSRGHRRLELTVQGREFFRRSMHILKGIDAIRDIAQDVRSTAAEPLRLVCTAPVARALFVPALGSWRAAHPDGLAMLDIETRFDMESKVGAREYNLGIVSLPQENAIVDLQITPLVSARYEIALPPDHPLARAPVVPVEALEGLPMISLRAGQRWRRRMEVICMTRGVTPRIAVETGSTPIAIELVRQGAGAMVVDRVCSSLRPDGFALRPLEPDMWTEYAAISGAGGWSDQTRAFMDMLRAHIQASRAACPDTAACVALA